MDEKQESSWLDEISLVTKIVVVVTVASVGGFALLKVVELFR
jgi:hypothetical protein